jgi:hypothetical protein
MLNSDNRNIRIYDDECKVSGVHYSGNNPFKNSVNKDIVKRIKGQDLLIQLKKGSYRDLKRNAFLFAAMKGEPSAIKGLISQIRIA